MPTLTSPQLELKRQRAHLILQTLQKHLRIRPEDFASLAVAKTSKDPFRVLVVTILSQSCTDKAAVRAYRNLDREIGVDPSRLGRADTREIEKAIRVAGLHHQKAKALKRLGQVIAANSSWSLPKILKQPINEARARLQELPKVGPKTADVLLNVWHRPTISVDTHVNRVSKRLGFTKPKAKYEEVRGSLMRLFDENDYANVPLVFMAHGRRFCKSSTPLCYSCPVLEFCCFPRKNMKQETRDSV